MTRKERGIINQIKDNEFRNYIAAKKANDEDAKTIYFQRIEVIIDIIDAIDGNSFTIGHESE